MTEAPTTGPTDIPGPIAVAMTGASGAQYGLRLIETLLDREREVHLVISATGRSVINTETDCRVGTKPQQVVEQLLGYFGRARTPRLQVFAEGDWFAPMASGSNPPAAVVICPCTMGTLAAIANGLSRSLIDRAADVALKEKRKLIVVPRETPFSTIHLSNMTTLAREGAVIMPPSPGFYHRPKTIDAMIDFIVGRILDHLSIDHDLMIKWGQERIDARQPD